MPSPLCRTSRDRQTVTCQTRDTNTQVGVRQTRNGARIWARQEVRTQSEALALQKKTGLPFCDGTGFPYVKGCYSDMSNWSAGPTPKTMYYYQSRY